MSKLILESLDEKRLNSFNKLSNFNKIGVLGGGTALALQIGHRKSYDFDIFVNDKINKKIWEKAKEVFGKDSYKTLESEDQLNLVTQDGINITFFHDDYKSLFNPIETEVIHVMDLRDIATNKALIQGRRPKWRDYVDLYFILEGNHITLENLVGLCLKKFGNDFSEKLFLEQLVYWDDIGSYEIEYINGQINTDTIKSFLENEVKEYKDKFLS